MSDIVGWIICLLGKTAMKSLKGISAKCLTQGFPKSMLQPRLLLDIYVEHIESYSMMKRFVININNLFVCGIRLHGRDRKEYRPKVQSNLNSCKETWLP